MSVSQVPAARRSGPTTADAIASARAAHERHFVRRARERFGLRVSAARYREFCRRVIEVDDAHGVRLIGRTQNPERTQWRAVLGGYPMRVVFDETTERLVTCMPFVEERKFDFGRDHRAKLRRVRAGKKKLKCRRARVPAIDS